MALPRRMRLLDPRRAALAQGAPFVDAVNIPLDELDERMHELPPKGETILVAAEPALGLEAIQFFAERGREARVVEFALGREALPGRLWVPNEFLLELLPDLKPGAAVDLGCGTGRNAVAMAAFGWDVTAIDILPDALERGRSLEGRYLGQETIRWAAQDLEVDSPQLSGSYDLVASFFYLNRALLEKINESLNLGGSFILETFTTVHREMFGKPRREHLALKPGELHDLLPSLEVVRYEEGFHGERHTARFWGRRPIR